MRIFSDACVYRATEEVVIQWGHDLELARNVGLAVVGGVIAWTMMSIFNVVGELSKGGSSYQSF